MNSFTCPLFLFRNVQGQAVNLVNNYLLSGFYLSFFGDGCPALAFIEDGALGVEGDFYRGCLADKVFTAGLCLFAVGADGAVDDKDKGTGDDYGTVAMSHGSIRKTGEAP